MFRIAVVLMCGCWAFAGWRNMPRLTHPAASAAGAAIAVSVGIAYWFGTRHAAQKVIATAVAKAEARADARATSTAQASARQVVLVNVNDGARAMGAAAYGDGTPEWVTGPKVAAVMDEETVANIAAELAASADEQGELA